jgi:hypothetical protein
MSLQAIAHILEQHGVRHRVVIAAATKKAKKPVTLKKPCFDVPAPLSKSYMEMRKSLFPSLPVPVTNSIKYAIGFALDGEAGATIYMAELQADILECYTKIKPLFQEHPELEEFWNHLKKWMADYKKFVADNGNFQPVHDDG